MSDLKPPQIWRWVPVCGPEAGDPCRKWHVRWTAKTGGTLPIAVYWQATFKCDCSAPCGVPGDGSGRQCLKPHPFACRTFRKLWISRSASPGALGDSWPLGVLLPLWGPAGWGSAHILFLLQQDCLPSRSGWSFQCVTSWECLKDWDWRSQGPPSFAFSSCLRGQALPLCPRASNAKQGQCLDPARNTASARVDKWGVWKTRMTPESWSPS